jgi:rhamnose transport system ATP-binding protein
VGVSTTASEGCTTPVLEVRGISKRFAATQALLDVDLDLVAGEVHCVVGENGAGKSTLAKIITGVESADAGTISVDGEPADIDDVHGAQQLGISAVYQQPMTFPVLTVAENVFAGRQPRLRAGTRELPVISWPQMRQAVSEIVSQLGIEIDPRTPMAALSTATQQLVEIAKALSINARILVLDEPTASLSSREVSALFRIVRDLTAKGVAVGFITHRLDEVFELADRVTVLRDGHLVGTHPIGEVTRSDVIRMMVGRSVEVLYPKQETTAGDVVLEADGLRRDGVFADVSFAVRAGEILGFAGLVGAGRTEVARALFGVDRLDAGTVRIAGQQVRPRSPRQMLLAGLGYLPEDRHTAGLVLPWPIFMNVSLAVLSRIRRRGSLVAPRIERELAERYVDALSIRARGVDQEIAALSGGNQQKALLGKWLATEPRVLVLDEPTRGIDVGAKVDVHGAIAELASKGLAIILISSELPEVLAMSDRVLVFCEGRITGHFTRTGATQELVMAAATDFEAAVTNTVAHGDVRLPAGPASRAEDEA